MGWSHCGLDSKGREIGYSIEALCDHPKCNKPIHRGLAYVCGHMHGEDEYSCEGYFCSEHQISVFIDDLLHELVDDKDLRKKIEESMLCYYWMYEKESTCLKCAEHNEKYLRQEILEMVKENENIKN